MAVRIVLADDHTLVREALRNLIVSRMPEVQIVGEAATGVETLDVCARLRPDILVLDVSMPDLGGLDVIAELKSLSPGTQVAVVSQHTDRAYVIRALKLGARAYVPKSALAGNLVGAISAVLAGRVYLDPSVADMVVAAAIHPEAPSSESIELAKLSTRESEVLKLTAEGKTAKEIGEALKISSHTANRHRANLMQKLGLHTKADLVKAAIRLKLIDV